MNVSFLPIVLSTVPWKGADQRKVTRVSEMEKGKGGDLRLRQRLWGGCRLEREEAETNLVSRQGSTSVGSGGSWRSRVREHWLGPP